MAVTAGAVQLRDALLVPSATAERPVTGPGAWGMLMVLLVSVGPVPLTFAAATVQE